ncbi:MAG: HD domain-containing protein [Planctomycetia bacterium]|nr:HD domain-containing protein [Planctomycetia bacterium]
MATRAAMPLVKLSEMSDGDEGDMFVLMSFKEELTTRDGKPYFKVGFRDALREVTFPVWQDSPLAAGCKNEWTPGQFYKLRAVYRESNYGPQLELRKVREVVEADTADGFDPLMCLPQTRFNVEQMFDELLSLVDARVGDAALKQLVRDILIQNREELLRFPAARRNHHAFAGGLLEHTLSVTRTSEHLADKYVQYYPDLSPPLDPGLVVAGAVLHDIGKLREYDVSPLGAEYSAAGHLVGHILQGRDIVREAAAGRGIDPELLLRLEHIIVAHQRLPEWGSPKPPMTPEALIVHHADDLDAKLNMFATSLAADSGSGPVTSNKNPLRQHIFRGLDYTLFENISRLELASGSPPKNRGLARCRLIYMDEFKDQFGRTGDDPFGDRSELLPKGAFLVPLAGLATTVLTLLVVWWLNKYADDFNIMGWYADHVIPIGALLVGFAAGSGYCLASWWRGVKIGGRLLAWVVVMQVAAYFAAQYLEYRDFDQRLPNGVQVGFVEYFDMATRSFMFKKVGHDPLNKNPAAEGMGAWGYLIRVAELAGFTLGGALAPILLMTKPYCERCQMYMRTRPVAMVPAGLLPKELKKAKKANTPEVQQRSQQVLSDAYDAMKDLVRLATAHDAAGFAAVCQKHSPRDKSVQKLSGRVEIVVSKCPHCQTGLLKGTLLAGLPDTLKKTELTLLPLTPEFVRQIEGRA